MRSCAGAQELHDATHLGRHRCDGLRRGGDRKRSLWHTIVKKFVRWSQRFRGTMLLPAIRIVVLGALSGRLPD